MLSQIGLGLSYRIGTEVEDRGGEHGARMPLFDAVDEIVKRADATGRHHGYMHRIGDGAHQFEVETLLGAVAIHRGHQQFAGTAFDHAGGKFNGIDARRVAAVSKDKPGLTGEAADVLYHLLVLLRAGGVSLDDVMAQLERRTRQSGLAEKASRTP